MSWFPGQKNEGRLVVVYKFFSSLQFFNFSLCNKTFCRLWGTNYFRKSNFIVPGEPTLFPGNQPFFRGTNLSRVPGGVLGGVPGVSYDPRTRLECERARTNATSASSYSHPYTFSYRRLYTLQNRCTSCIHLSLSARTSGVSYTIGYR